MALQKNDPVYYKKAMRKLIDGAIDNGLTVICRINGTNETSPVSIDFKDLESGECASVYLEKEEQA